jgi:serine phosphatase RsbU (regulator of sigma subunit)
VDVKSLIQKSAGQLFDDLLAAVRAFSISHEFEDDVCLVGIEFIGKPA